MIPRTRGRQPRGSTLKLLVFAPIALLLLAAWAVSLTTSESTSPGSEPASFPGTARISSNTQARHEPSASGNLSAQNQIKRTRRVPALTQQAAPPPPASSAGGPLAIEGKYRCAKHCICSLVQVLDRDKSGNLTQATCESANFSDLLTIDRRTQIIHISLPAPSNSNFVPAANGDERDEQSEPLAQSFRMPRLVQFSILREIVIINLKFEVCDSEVFKRGQKLRRLQLNRNHLSRISKACLRHLEKLLELNLDYNELEELESALFNSLLNLRSLSIAHNKLSELAAHQFANLTQLVSLNLVGNNFKTINLHLLEPMQASLRLLVLADNQIKSFVYAPLQQQVVASLKPSANSSTPTIRGGVSPFAGVLFKNLIKLNVDRNKFERVKNLQLNRFYNVKYLSIRQNLIASIRDKAFNGLKLIELNLARNQLQSVSKCAFCNATVKRLVLAHNNITLPLPSLLLEGAAQPSNAAALLPRPSASVASTDSQQVAGGAPEQAAQVSLPDQSGAVPSASSSQSMLILSQSIFGPLFGQLEYLDLSGNELLANQLDHLLEPLLNLEYLNIAAVGLDRSLSSPSLFKNLRQLRYLNISRNQLDQVIAETIEPLSQLEVLDMSYNKFSELEETFLVAADELSALKLINLSSNPWFCSQCKVAPLYDWILRSAIYNSTCMAASYAEQQLAANPEASDDGSPVPQQSDGLTYSAKSNGRHDYSLLIGDEQEKGSPAIDFDLVLGSALDDDLLGSYNLLGGQTLAPTTASDAAASSSPVLSTTQHLTMGIRDLAIEEDDESIAQTINAATILERSQVRSGDYCLKCEFPGELHSYNIHELSSGDFKLCAGAAPRFAASEPKLGLTLAIVIIGAFICIIIVVILMYRKKSNTYYTNEDTDHLQTGKKAGLSVSSDVERQYGDGTDYSSPPMSQSFESYTSSQEDADLDEEDLNEDEEEDEEEEEVDEGEDEDEEENEESAERQKSHRIEPDEGDRSQQAQLRRMISAEQERHQQLADYERRQNSQQSLNRSSSGRSSQPVDQQQHRSSGALNEGATTPSVRREAGSRGIASPAKRSQHSAHSNHSIRLSTASAVPSVRSRAGAADVGEHAQVAASDMQPQTAADRAIEHFQHELMSPVATTSRPPVVSRVKSSQSAGSQTQPPIRLAGSHSVQSGAKRLDSAGSTGSRSRLPASVAGRAEEFRLEPGVKLDLDADSRYAEQHESLEKSSSVRRPGKAVRAAYQLATGLRPQSSGGVGAHSAGGGDSPSARSYALSTGGVYPNRPAMVTRQQQTSGAGGRDQQAGQQLGRQRFAQSKDLSQPAAYVRHGPPMTAAAVRRIANQEMKLVPQSSGEEDLEALDMVMLKEAARRADSGSKGRQMAQVEYKRSSPASDATTADSLALEALADYEAPVDEMEEPRTGASSFGGALAVAEDSGDDYELDFEHEQPTDEHLLQVFQQTRQPNPASAHSALTQTGSRESDEL